MLLTLALPATSLSTETIDLSASIEESTDGKFVLSWQVPAGQSIELQQFSKSKDDFRTLYRGTDTSSVITGLADGDYWFRIRALSADGQPSGWSTPVSVAVRHHPLSRAFGFFAVGATVFIATLILIVLGTGGRLNAPAGKENTHVR